MGLRAEEEEVDAMKEGVTGTLPFRRLATEADVSAEDLLLSEGAADDLLSLSLPESLTALGFPFTPSKTTLGMLGFDVLFTGR